MIKKEKGEKKYPPFPFFDIFKFCSAPSFDPIFHGFVCLSVRSLTKTPYWGRRKTSRGDYHLCLFWEMEKGPRQTKCVGRA